MVKRADLDTLTLLRAIEQHRFGAWDHLAQHYPRKIIIAAIQRDARRGLVNWGVAAHLPWLEPKGEQVLRDAQTDDSQRTEATSYADLAPGELVFINPDGSLHREPLCPCASDPTAACDFSRPGAPADTPALSFSLSPRMINSDC